jgi:cell division protein FtsI/penicillin-binding protein 2
MDRSNQEEEGRRWNIVIGLFALFAMFLVAYLIVGQFLYVPEGTRSAASAGSIELPRGTLTDRQGYCLALDVFEYDVDASPAGLSDARKNTLADKIAPILNMPREQIREKLDTRNAYITLAKKQNAATADAIWKVREEMGPVIKAVAHPTRYYPEGHLAAHVLGFVNADPGGCYGIEGYYESDLGRKRLPLESLGSATLADVQSSGTTLTLSLDRYAQMVVERELDAAMTQTRALSGQVIVMVPQTGEILAMASRPTYNPAEFWKSSDDTWANPAISQMYEPGSVFKIITYAAALDAGTITPNTLFNDPGMVEIGGRKIYNWDRQGHGTVDIIEALGNSLNVVAATTTQKMGRETFYNYIRKFGFGQLTEIDLKNEVSGLVKTPTGDPTWSDSDLGTNSFGQGISVTPIQMLSAVASIANGGVLMSPQVVLRKNVGGQVTEMNPQTIRRTVSRETAQTLTSLLVRVVDEWLPEARVPGYSIAGKTGTAEIPIGGGYHATDYIASFVGYGPATNPQLVILVKLDRPQVDRSGRAGAVPVFQRVAASLFKYFQIPPDRAN